MVWHLIARCNSIDYSLSGSAIKLSSFEFGLRLFLLIYSRTTVIDRYGFFTALKEDVYELRVMSKFFTGMKMIFASVPQCVIHKKSLTEFIKNLKRLSGRLVKNVQHLFCCNYC